MEKSSVAYSQCCRIVFVGLPDSTSYNDALAQPQYLGQRYLAAVLRARGYAAEIRNVALDPSALEKVLFATDSQWVEEVIQEMIVAAALEAAGALDLQRCLLGFTLSWKHVSVAARVIRAIKRKYPCARIVVGGVLATLYAGQLSVCLPEADFIVLGEAEQSIVLLMDALAGRISLDAVPGLVYRGSDGFCRSAAPPQAVKELDELPFPANDDIAFICERNESTIRLCSSRGCYGRCSFCSINAFNQAMKCAAPRVRSAGNVVDELEYWNRDYGIKTFVFCDPNFMASGQRGRQRAMDIARGIQNRGLHISFKIDCRVTDIHPSVLSVLREAGLYAVELGLESFDDYTLAVLNKKTSVAQNLDAVRTLGTFGLQAVLSYIFYTPWTTCQTMRSTLPLIKRVFESPHVRWFPVFKTLKPILGTPLCGTLASEGCLIEEGWTYDYSTTDREADDIRRTHMAFQDQVEALIQNTPPWEAPMPGALGQHQGSILAALNRLTITYLEALLNDDRGGQRQCHGKLAFFRASLMALHKSLSAP